MTLGRRRLVRVPASSANLGPGFDVMAAALALHLELEVVETGTFAVRTRAPDLRRPRQPGGAGVRAPAPGRRVRVPDHVADPDERRSGVERGGDRGRADGRRPPVRARRRRPGPRRRARGPSRQRRGGAGRRLRRSATGRARTGSRRRWGSRRCSWSHGGRRHRAGARGAAGDGSDRRCRVQRRLRGDADAGAGPGRLGADLRRPARPPAPALPRASVPALGRAAPAGVVAGRDRRHDLRGRSHGPVLVPVRAHRSADAAAQPGDRAAGRR